MSSGIMETRVQSQMKQPEELIIIDQMSELLNKIHNLLIYIQSSQMGSIGGIDTHYLPQISRKTIDELCDKIGDVLSKYNLNNIK